MAIRGGQREDHFRTFRLSVGHSLWHTMQPYSDRHFDHWTLNQSSKICDIHLPKRSVMKEQTNAMMVSSTAAYSHALKGKRMAMRNENTFPSLTHPCFVEIKQPPLGFGLFKVQTTVSPMPKHYVLRIHAKLISIYLLSC